VKIGLRPLLSEHHTKNENKADFPDRIQIEGLTAPRGAGPIGAEGRNVPALFACARRGSSRAVITLFVPQAALRCLAPNSVERYQKRVHFLSLAGK